MPEVRRLLEDARTGRRFIAVLSPFDERLRSMWPTEAQPLLEQWLADFIEFAYAHPSRWRSVSSVP